MSDHDPTRVDPALVAGNRKPLAGYQARHFAWQADGSRIGHLTG